MASKEQLEKRLAFHLGFDDGAGNVLDHLLTIESKRELLEYLQQLLGNDSMESINIFVDDVESFRRGETLSCMEETVQLETLATQQQTKSRDKKSLDSRKHCDSQNMLMDKPKNSLCNKGGGRSKLGVESDRLGAQIVATKPSQGGTSSEKLATLKKSLTNDTAKPASLKSARKEQQLVLQQPSTKSNRKNETSLSSSSKEQSIPPPPRGTPSVICGCFGTRHSALINCLYCGRIACEREGYDFCAFCGLLVEQRVSKQDDAAWKLKEQLLQFDREHVKRTMVYDDQADYLGNRSSAWLDEGEKEKARIEEEKRAQDIVNRKKQQLDVAF